MTDISGEAWLQEQYSSKPWFHSVGKDQYGRYVVYVKYSCMETLSDIVDQVAGKQVMVHFASSLNSTREQYTTVLTARKPPEPEPTLQEEMDSVAEVDSPVDLSELTTELDKLEKVCGSNILQDIFYEVHDGINAVTNLSTRYPAVRESLDRLYVQYGFDIIYEELDG